MRTALDRRRFLERLAAGLAATLWLGRPQPAAAATTETLPFLGQIMLYACNFPPKGWAFCHGQFLPIQQNQGLFSLLGTTYGGNGQTTFQLPDLRDRVPIHFGQGNGLSTRTLGERSGVAAHTLVLTELPAHTHGVRASSALATALSPGGMYPARDPASYWQYAAAAPDATMTAVGLVGGSQPHDNTQPCTGLHFCIALQGVFPSQT